MQDGNDVEIRRARLRALRERYEQNAATVEIPPPEPSRRRDAERGSVAGHRKLAGPGRGRGAETARLPVPVQRRPAGPKDGGGQRAAGGLLQRVAAFLTQEGPGAKFVAGTRIREDRLGQLVQFLKRRGAAANGQQAQRARGVLAYLTETAPGERMIAGVNIVRAALLLERADGQQPHAKGRAVDFAEDTGIIEGDVLAVESDAAEDPVEEDSLSALVERAQRLSEELLAVQNRIARRVAGQTEAAQPAATARPDIAARSDAPKPSPKSNGEWYMDFLD